MDTIRILKLGHCSYVFIHPLTVALRKQGDYAVSVVNLNRPGNEEGATEDVEFDAVFPTPNLSDMAINTSFDPVAKRLKVWDQVGQRQVAEFDPALYSEKHDYSDIEQVVIDDLMARKYAELAAGFDVVQMMYMDPRWLSAFRYVPPNVGKIVSIFGSDLFRLAGISVYRKQLEALEQADLITIHSVEMKEVLLAKFGRHLAPKVRYAFFGLNSKLLDLIDRYREHSGKGDFRKQHSIGEDRTILCVGHSAASRHQHIDVLNRLRAMPEKYRDRITVVVPGTYNSDDSYLMALRHEAKTPGLDVRILENYLDDDEIAQLRAASDIMVQVPETDAFSASMLETMYGGNVIVAGSWLPYGRMRREGLAYHELEELSELSVVIPRILENWVAERRASNANVEKVRGIFGQDATIAGWKAVYDEAVSMPRRQTSHADVA